MAKDFIYCPTCGCKDFINCGYEDENGDDTDEIQCKGCGWEGLPDELVCKETEAK